jgi:hypothetical protein
MSKGNAEKTKEEERRENAVMQVEHWEKIVEHMTESQGHRRDVVKYLRKAVKAFNRLTDAVRSVIEQTVVETSGGGGAASSRSPSTEKGDESSDDEVSSKVQFCFLANSGADGY